MSDNAVLVPELINKMYFRIKSQKKDNDEKTEPVEFDRAELFDQNSEGPPLVGNITHVYNGYGSFEFVPKEDKRYELKVYRKFSETDEISKTFELSDVDSYEMMTMSMENGGVFGPADEAIRFRFDTNLYFLKE